MNSNIALPRAFSQRLQFVWILDPKRDLLFYIGSALVGWLYVAIIVYAIYALDNPLTDSLGELRIGGIYMPLTLQLLVVVSWAFILDAPHVWATLARTLFDPDEWRVRRNVILFSFVWFLVGPVAILLPYLIGALTAQSGHILEPATLALGAVGFFVFFRLWAYYHVVRQHWGFFGLYKRKAQDTDHGGPRDRLDRLFFNLTLYLPLVMFMSSTYYAKTPGFPDLGLRTPVFAGISIGEILYPLAWGSFLVVLVYYFIEQWRRWRNGETLNGSKLLYMLLIIPLHLVAFSHPILAVFIVPLVTVGHNIQYHCIVYQYAKNKYGRTADQRYRVANALFKNFAIYAFWGILFTFGFYRGPWIEWLKDALGVPLDRVMLNSIGMMAGIKNPETLGLGEQMFAAFIVGFAMQHYYLDSKIWRVSKDRDVARNLNVG